MALTGCDLLTIAPKLLAELEASTETVEKCLDAEAAKGIKKFHEFKKKKNSAGIVF